MEGFPVVDVEVPAVPGIPVDTAVAVVVVVLEADKNMELELAVAAVRGVVEDVAGGPEAVVGVSLVAGLLLSLALE